MIYAAAFVALLTLAITSPSTSRRISIFLSWHSQPAHEHLVDRTQGIGRRPDVFGGDVVDVGNGVDDHPDDALAALAGHVHDDDDRGRIVRNPLEPEPNSKVDDRHDRAAQIDHAEYVRRRVRHPRHGIPTLDLLNLLMSTPYSSLPRMKLRYCSFDGIRSSTNLRLPRSH
jgi:hypothetical protein